MDAEPCVHAIRVATGVGKTRIAARLIAETVLGRKAEGRPMRPFLYAVPTHRLGEDIAGLFRQHGISARVFRGRAAQDPGRPGRTMCDDMEAVKVALDLGAPVSTSCCKGKRPGGATATCRFYESCAYQQQTKDRPDVWVVAHQLLFSPQAALGDVGGVFIDESFWQAGIWVTRRPLTLDEIAAPVALVRAGLDEVVADVENYRASLARALRRQPETGGVARRHLVAEGLNPDECTRAIALEWKLKGTPAIWPGMPAAERRAAASSARGARHVRSFVNIWTAARDLLHNHDLRAVSGRLILDDLEGEHGVSRVVRTQGVRAVAKQWRAPTFIMDATLPGPEILKAFYPQGEIIADIDATMPHVLVRQVLGAPVSASKLIRNREGDASRNLKAIRRAILHRHLQVRRQPTLVIAQKAVAEWLKASWLPAGISVEHFNNVAGLDRYKNVRLLICIGRTMPSVFEVEAFSGALTGVEAQKTPEPARPPRWYARILRGLRRKDGTGVGVQTDQHPDATAEACRWQICEGELVQALGRARGVNRTAETPLDIDILADVVLPVTVDQVLEWSEVPSGAEIEMIADGIVLGSPTDMAACWPDVWETPEAARQWQKRSTSGQSPIENILYREMTACDFRYQRPGARQKWRNGSFDPTVVPDPQAWLEARLGLLARLEVVARAAAV